MNKKPVTITQYAVVEAGKLAQNGDFVRYKYKIPSYAQKLTGVFPFSEQLCSMPGEYTEVILSLSINNEEAVVVSEPFTLGYRVKSINNLSRMKSLQETLKPGQYITGYVECVNNHLNTPFDVKVYLVYETEEKK